MEELLSILKRFTLPRDFLNTKVRNYIESSSSDMVGKVNRSTERYQTTTNADLVGSELRD